MNNKEPKGVIASLQALGLIDKENKVTVQGIDTLTRYVAHANNGEIQDENEKEWRPDYSETWEMDDDEVIKWEEKNHSAKILCADDYLEVMPTKPYHINKSGEKVYTDEVLYMSMTSINPLGECSVVIESKKEIIKLRDFLTKFIEKDENWFDIKKIEENN